MRIVHYLPGLTGPESGSANAGRGWCQALADRGTEVVALADKDAGARVPPPGLRTVMVSHALAGPFRVPLDTAEEIEGADLAVVHGGWVLGNILFARACRRANVPYVVIAHGAYACEVWGRKKLAKSAWAALLERRHLARATAVHVFFPEDRASIGRCMGTATPTVVAPNGITPPADVTWDGGTGGYLLWLGRFDPETKGLDLLIRAMAQMPRDRRPELRLHGRDWRNGKSRVRHMVREQGLQSWVEIAEPVYGREKWETLTKAAGFVYPSRWDACPMAVTEAAAVGVPTLVGRYPLGNLLVKRNAAVQVDADASSLAGGIQELLSDRGREVGANAALVAKRELSWEAVSRSWLEQVTDLLAERSR